MLTAFHYFGCNVVDFTDRQPYTKKADLLGITHCFVDRRMTELSADEKRTFQEARVPLLTMMFIQACVEQDVMPNVEDFRAR